MQNLYIYGCGGVGRELAELLFGKTDYNLAGFIDDNPSIRECMGFECRTLDELLREKELSSITVIISFGEPAIRKKVSTKLQSMGIREKTVDLSRHFNPAFSSVEDGCILHDDSFISINARIGKSCMINKGVLVGHDCRIGNYTVISPRVSLGGDVSVGDESFIGSGAVIRNGVSIGNNVIVGMGSVVTKNVEDNSVVVGNPAEFIRKNEKKRVFSTI